MEQARRTGSVVATVATTLLAFVALATIAFPLLGVGVALAGIVLARRGRPRLGLALVAFGLAFALVFFLILYGVGSGSTGSSS